MNKNNGSPLDELLRKQTGACASIVVSLFSPANMRKQNVNIISKAVAKAKAALDVYRTSDQAKKLISNNLDELLAGFRNDGKAKGLGLFASESVARAIEFPFEVNEMTLVADSFETRDVFYLNEYLKPYHALLVGASGARLFRGVAESMEEIRNKEFPVVFNDDREYQRSSLGSSFGYAMKGFEKDKGAMVDTRLKSMLHDTIKYLPALIGDSHTELVIVGPAKLSNQAASLLPLPLVATAVIARAVNGKNFGGLSKAVWAEVLNARQRQKEALIKQLDDLGFNYRVDGLRRVWEAANKGKGRVLLVERDFRRGAYQPEGLNQIRLQPPLGTHTRIVDAVDDVIEKVTGMGGTIVFTEPKQLSKYEGIALMLRYR